MLLLTILEKAQCFPSEDETASIGVSSIHLVSPLFAGKHDTVPVLLHECATSDAMHKILSALLESITTTNVALALMWIHVLFSRKKKETNKGSGENAKDDNSAARATEESPVDHEYVDGRPNRGEDENSLMESWVNGATSDIPSIRTKTGSRKRFPKNRRRTSIRAHYLRRTKKYVPTLDCIQEGFDEDANASSSC